MYSIGFTIRVLALASLTLALGAAVQAQNRTWVSGVGDDINPCSRTAPCKTWAGAQSKTATGGEIDALDPGGFGAVTITKALTLDGTTGAGFGGVLASGTSGITVNVTTNLSTDKVVLRNLSLNGSNAAGGFHGIRFLDGAELTVENVVIFDFTGDGINISQAQQSTTHIRNVTVNRVSGTGVEATTTVGQAVVTLEDSSIHGTSSGFDGIANVRGALKNTTFDSGTTCVKTSGSNSILNADALFVSFCSTGIQASAGSTINVGNSMIVQNATGLNLNGGTINSMSGNTLFSNTVPGAFSFTQVKL
jgi:hypothetical protein